MRALDLYCGAGGAGRGLQLAGFAVDGVDVIPQPRYCGERFIRGDALEFLRGADLSPYDLIWASPPCQRYTSLRHAPGAHRDADLIAPTRALLERSGKSWVIENVVGAPLIRSVTLCGTMFDLGAPSGAELRRHRQFEASFPVRALPCRHGRGPVIGVYGGHFRDRRRPAGANHLGGSNLPRAHGYAAMRIDWPMTTTEISDAIPPAFAHYVAKEMLRAYGRAAGRLIDQSAFHSIVGLDIDH
jgi:DNA (cytosine-5)-methyltransferase 1